MTGFRLSTIQLPARRHYICKLFLWKFGIMDKNA